MDDFVVFGASKRELRLTHDAIVAELAALGLEPKARATVVAPCHVGLPFLGWRIYRGTMRVRPENLRRSRRRIAVREQQCRRGALDERQLSDAVRSVVAHLRCGDTMALRRRWFASEPSIDDATNTGTVRRLLVEPQQPRRQLQQRRSQRTVRQPQQERADDPQQRPRRARRQDVTPPDGAVAAQPARSRSAP